VGSVPFAGRYPGVVGDVGYRNRHAWTFIQFTVVLLEAIMLYLLAAIVLPNIPDEGEVDLRKNYFRHAGWFFGPLVVLLLDSLLKSVVVSGGLPGKLDLGFHLFWITTAFIAAFTRRERYHKAFVCLSFAVFITYHGIAFSLAALTIAPGAPTPVMRKHRR
jgi:hypothetical protein